MHIGRNDILQYTCVGDETAGNRIRGSWCTISDKDLVAAAAGESRSDLS